MQGQPGGYISPDGRWRWDGREWVPNPPPHPVANTIMRFGGFRYWSGAGVLVQIKNGYVTVKGAPGFDRAYAAITDIETVTVQVGALGAGPGNRRFTYIELVGRGTVLGRAAVNTLSGVTAAKVAYEAAAWLRSQLGR